MTPSEKAFEFVARHMQSGKPLITSTPKAFKPGDRISILATSQSRLMLLGGEPMDGPRHIWWNFVSSSKDRIEAAKADWKANRFALVPGDEIEKIPLPER